MLKSELRKKSLDNSQKEDLQRRLTLLDSFIAELKLQHKELKDNLKQCQAKYSESKKALETYREE